MTDFVWPRFVGGPAHGKPIEPPNLKHAELAVPDLPLTKLIHSELIDPDATLRVTRYARIPFVRADTTTVWIFVSEPDRNDRHRDEFLSDLARAAGLPEL